MPASDGGRNRASRIMFFLCFLTGCQGLTLLFPPGSQKPKAHPHTQPHHRRTSPSYVPRLHPRVLVQLHPHSSAPHNKPHQLPHSHPHPHSPQVNQPKPLVNPYGKTLLFAHHPNHHSKHHPQSHPAQLAQHPPSPLAVTSPRLLSGVPTKVDSSSSLSAPPAPPPPALKGKHIKDKSKDTKDQFRLRNSLLKFTSEARANHGPAWTQILLKKFMGQGCPITLLHGASQIMPPWITMAFKQGADIQKKTSGVFLDWMRYGNYCGNQMHGNYHGDREVACSGSNGLNTTYKSGHLSYDTCDDCGLDSGCAKHASSWVHQYINQREAEKGPTMCMANAQFAEHMVSSAENKACDSNFRDGFGVPENGFRTVAKCAMLFEPCINYEGPHLLVLEFANPLLFEQCRLTSKLQVIFLACLAAGYMEYRVPFFEYKSIKQRCAPLDVSCFIQEDARDGKTYDTWGGISQGVPSFDSPVSNSTGSHLITASGSRCGPIGRDPGVCGIMSRFLVIEAPQERSFGNVRLVNDQDLAMGALQQRTITKPGHAAADAALGSDGIPVVSSLVDMVSEAETILVSEEVKSDLKEIKEELPPEVLKVVKEMLEVTPVTFQELVTSVLR